MHFSEIQREGYRGLRVIPELTPASIFRIQHDFVYRTEGIIHQALLNQTKLDIIFPAKGSSPYIYSLNRRAGILARNGVEVYSAIKKGDEYIFVSNIRGEVKEGDPKAFSGSLMIVDEIFDTGKSFKGISNAISKVIGLDRLSEVGRNIRAAILRTRSGGVFPIPILVPTTKEGKLYNKPLYIYPSNNGKDQWITCGNLLDGGKGDDETKRKERLSGMSCAVIPSGIEGIRDSYEYEAMLADESSRAQYYEGLTHTGIQSYGQTGYSEQMHVLEIMDNAAIDEVARCMMLYDTLGLLKE